MLFAKLRVVLPTGKRCGLCVIGLFFLALLSQRLDAQSQAESPFYARRNTFGFFVAYANDSSHILLGTAENRKLFDVGASYDRRLIAGRIVNWEYSVEILPVALESDPVENTTFVYTSDTNPPETSRQYVSVPTVGACHPQSGSGSIPNFFSYTYTSTCTRRWTIGEAMSPVGFQWNFRPRRKLQPFAVAHGGYMYSTQPIPTASAGSFNFTFDFGAGVELFRTRSQSLRAEYRFHHISNGGTAQENPGIDSGLFQVSWAFGR
jgi:hypothetical protein